MSVDNTNYLNILPPDIEAISAGYADLTLPQVIKGFGSNAPVVSKVCNQQLQLIRKMPDASFLKQIYSSEQKAGREPQFPTIRDRAIVFIYRRQSILLNGEYSNDPDAWTLDQINQMGDLILMRKAENLLSLFHWLRARGVIGGIDPSFMARMNDPAIPPRQKAREFSQWLKTHPDLPVTWIDWPRLSAFSDIPEELLTLPLDRTTLRAAWAFAAEKGSFEFIFSLIKNPRFREISGPNFRDAFWTACRKGHLSVVEILIRNRRFCKVSPNELGEALRLACTEGRSASVQALIASSRFSEIPPSELGIAFGLACRFGHLEIVKTFMGNRFFVAVSPPAFRDAFWTACKNGHLPVVQALIANSRFHQGMPVEDLTGALGLACENGRREIVEALRTSGRFREIPSFAKSAFKAVIHGHFALAKSLYRKP